MLNYYRFKLPINDLTKSVVAIWFVFVATGAVGAVGTPVKVAELNTSTVSIYKFQFDFEFILY